MHGSRSRTIVATSVLVTASVLLLGCAAGDPRYSAEAPAGFWAGLWHGIISVIALVVGLFHEGVEIYERNNTGGWYDFGFLLGVTAIWGGSCHTAQRRRWSRHRAKQDAEWEEIGRKVEAKMKRTIRRWAEAEPDEDWNVVEAKAEAKLKRKVREWAEEPDGPQ